MPTIPKKDILDKIIDYWWKYQTLYSSKEKINDMTMIAEPNGIRTLYHSSILIFFTGLVSLNTCEFRTLKLNIIAKKTPDPDTTQEKSATLDYTES